MAMERMHDVLYARLDTEGANDSVKAVWQALWNQAQTKPGEPLPCPVCFAANRKVHRVAPRDNVGDLAKARCDFCHTEFEWPDHDG